MRRFWPVAVVIVAAIGGLLYLAQANTAGTSRVWTSLVTVAGGFGLTGASLQAAAKRTGAAIEQPLWQTAEIDARAWAVTWLPTIPMGPIRRHRLSRRGVAVPTQGARLEAPPNSPKSPSRPQNAVDASHG
jgi:hypothetical protein